MRMRMRSLGFAATPVLLVPGAYNSTGTLQSRNRTSKRQGREHVAVVFGTAPYGRPGSATLKAVAKSVVGLFHDYTLIMSFVVSPATVDDRVAACRLLVAVRPA